MYLPTDMKTIYNVLIKSHRDSRKFWTEVMGRSKKDPTVQALNGRIGALMDLRDGFYII